MDPQKRQRDLLIKLLGSNFKKYGLLGAPLLLAALVISMVIGGGTKITSNIGSTNVVNGDNNYVNQISGENVVVTGSAYKDEQEKIWDDAYVPIQDFINKLNNRDFEGARKLLDKQLIKDPKFSEIELKQFMDNVDGKVTIRDLQRDEAKKKDDEFISNRGFYLSLRYLKDNTQISERWRITAIKYNQEDNKWKIGEMWCEDKNCENKSLLAEKNY